MSSEDKLQEVFSGFVAAPDQRQTVKECYEVQPWLNSRQQRALMSLELISQRYGGCLDRVLETYKGMARTNRPVGATFTRLVQAASLESFTRDMMRPPAQVGSLLGGRKG